ncbi:MAG: metallophosphoesterase [Planctomycetota bacterium]|nr:MAG: metallophosphoesterase [Planctomycetota bacterium]
MKRAIISDIHGNLTALQTVLRDAEEQGCTQVLCLGDIVGYGPCPAECIDLVSELDASILGNHDLAALFDPEGFSSTAEQAIMWTRRQIETGDTPQTCYRRLEFLAYLPRTRREGDTFFVHGSIRNPVNEYVFPEDVYNQRKMEKLFSMIRGVCYQGHTHVPGVFTEEGTFLRPADIDYQYRLGQGKAMINVGSVGQPRDGDWRTCYVVVEDDLVTFRRLEYDVESTIRQIHAIDDLDPYLGDRLREGK